MRKILIGLCLSILFIAGCSDPEVKTDRPPEEEFWVIAHRGASAYAPENTTAAYDLAKEMDADYIELDVHLTKDGEVVVMHDEDVDRTTDGTGEIAQYTLAELKELSANFRFPEEKSEQYSVPLLAELFERYGNDIHYFIELKKSKNDDGIEEAVIDLLEQYDMIGRSEDGKPKTVIHSFSEKLLKRVHELNKDIPLVILIPFKDEEHAELSEQEMDEISTYSAGVAISHEFLNQAFVERLHEKKLVVYATDVQEEKAALQMKSIGADGIYTNRPDIGQEKE